MSTAASEYITARAVDLKTAFPEQTSRYWIWVILMSLLIVACTKALLSRKRRNELLWKIPGCNVNRLLLFLAVAKSLVLNNTIKTNILSFQVLCGTTILFNKEKLWRMWIGLKPVVVLFKPEAVEVILEVCVGELPLSETLINTLNAEKNLFNVKYTDLLVSGHHHGSQSVNVILNSNTVLKKTFMYKFLNYWFKEGLITSSGNKWRARRKLLTPAFHFRILGDFQPVIDEQSRVLCQVLEEKMGQVFDVVQPVTLCTLDILCETAMGIKIQAQRRNSEYVDALKIASEQFSDRVMKPWVWSDIFYYCTRDGKNYKRNVETMLKFTSSVIRERKLEMLEKRRKDQQAEEHVTSQEIEPVEMKKRKAFLDLLLDLHIKDNILTEEDIREEVDTFMFAGHDTTAMGISWALYNIGLRPDVQETIHEELDRIFANDHERAITTEDVREMKYLECVLKESQRLYPSLPVIGRELEEDVTIDGYTIPEGTTCMLATFMLHRNPEVFPNPELFDPDRFLPENCSGRHPFAYVPFSAGPRNCIGQRFAMLEEKTIVANILRRFKIETIDSRDKLRLTAEMVLRNDGELRIRLHKRDL